MTQVSQNNVIPAQAGIQTRPRSETSALPGCKIGRQTGREAGRLASRNVGTMLPPL